MMKKNRIGVAAMVWAVIFMPMVSFAQEAPTDVVHEIIIDGSGASEPYQLLYKRFSEVYKKYDSAGQRSLWFSGLAGPDTGVNIVRIHYPSISAYADDAEIVPSPEYQALAQELFQKGFRVVSNSLNFRSD